MAAGQRHRRGTASSAAPALRIFVASRLVLWALALGTLLLFDEHLNPERGRWDTERLHDLGRGIDVWARWDSDWYLRIAENGYREAPSSTPAFFPLYPALVGLLGRLLLGHYVLAGVLVSLAAGAAAFVLLLRLGTRLLGERAARRALLLLAVFPTSLFFGAVYSESLYLLLAVAAFLLAERRQWLDAGGAAGLALLTRPAGIALLPALALLAWRAEDRRGALIRLGVALPLAALYPLLLWAWIDEPFAFLRAQEGIWQRGLSPAGPFGGLWRGVAVLWEEPSGKELLINGRELGLTLVFVALAVVAWRRLGPVYGLFAALSLAVPLSYPADPRPLLSLSRFGLVAFPLVLALATLTERRASRVAIVSASAALLGLGVVQWALWRWVA